MWCLLNPARLQAEQDAITALAAAAPWLEIVGWRIGEFMRLECQAQIHTPTRDYDITLVYGAGFPDTPPSVLPRGATERWSAHQFGAGGELCLEYGPDNWQPVITGAMLLESAHRLLETEAPPAPGEVALPEVASRHALTRGQAMRPKHFRMTFSPAFAQHLEAVAGPLAARFSVRKVEDTWLTFPFAVTGLDGAAWTDGTVPPPEQVGGNAWPGFAQADAAAINTQSAQALRRAVLGEDAAPTAESELFLLRHDGAWRAFWTFPGPDSDTVAELALFAPEPAARLAPEYTALGELKLGLVGAGSVGSKVATMLARAGVRRFEVLDDDVLRQENLVRNELDWADVGLHKANALRQRLLRVRPDAEVTVRRLHLGGQEAAGSADVAVLALSRCDLLIDATAAGIAFNLIAAAARLGTKPMLWVEVFAGGVGGVIARARPGLDPPPQAARAQVNQWYADRDTPFPGGTPVRYELDRDGEPLIADDADVSVIAGYLGRLALDTLLARAPSAFPVSAYVIGLKQEWIFEQPFDVWPVDLGPAPAAEPGSDDPALIERGVATLVALIESRDAPTPAT